MTTEEVRRRYTVSKEVVTSISWKADRTGGGVSKRTELIAIDQPAPNLMNGVIDAQRVVLRSITCPKCPGEGKWAEKLCKKCDRRS